MDILYFNKHTFTNVAIEHLKNAYAECSDNTVKESIHKVFMALVQLNYDLGKYDDEFKAEDGCDPSEYCAAV